jgi:NAD-dependent deacetylase
VDDLHDRAGSRRLLHLHGELRKARCQVCRSIHPWDDDIEPVSACPGCSAIGKLRPHIVWFGEMPLDLNRIFSALAECDLFVSIGTSGNVYPAAGFAQAVSPKARTIELNLQTSEVSQAFQEHRLGPASQTVPEFVRDVLAGC